MPALTTPATDPHNSEAERSLLGALLLDPERLFEIIPIIRSQDFYDPVLGSIFAALLSLHDERQPIDFVTVASKLSDDAKLQAIGGSAFLAGLADNTPTSSHAAHYAQIVCDKAQKRALAKLAERLKGLALDPQVPADAGLDQAEQMLLQLTRQPHSRTMMLLGDAAPDAYDRYAQLHEAEDKQAFYGITTGFGRLDRMLAGMAPGHLMVLAARPSMGKTALALDIARNVAAQGKKVAFFSLEMSRDEIMDRIISGYLGVETWKLKRGLLSDGDFTRMGPIIDDLKKHPIYIDDDPNTALSNLRSKARRAQLEFGLDLLIVDYLQLIEVTDGKGWENRVQQVSHISRSLKNLARELNAPVLALSQLSRACETRTPAIPILSDLRDSGSIEQDADSVLMLYRQGYYDEDCDGPDVTDIYLRKNRNGATGRVELRFDAAKMSFGEIVRAAAVRDAFVTS